MQTKIDGRVSIGEAKIVPAEAYILHTHIQSLLFFALYCNFESTYGFIEYYSRLIGKKKIVHNIFSSSKQSI